MEIEMGARGRCDCMNMAAGCDPAAIGDSVASARVRRPPRCSGRCRRAQSRLKNKQIRKMKMLRSMRVWLRRRRPHEICYKQWWVP